MAIEVLSVNRIGQISGATDPSSWRLLRDPVGNPLLTDTGRWQNAIGLDLGANTEHSDGRLYIFSGDVRTRPGSNDPPESADLVAWVDEPAPLHMGGHLADGWHFELPITAPGIEGQPDWQMCLKCSALFYNGNSFKGRCSLDGGTHNTFGYGYNFSLPFEPTGIHGQPQWRFCVQCGSLFFEGDGTNTGVCPGGGTHLARPRNLRYVIPYTPDSQGGQQVPRTPGSQDSQQYWRYCDSCHGLFFDGYPSKGICVGSRGGGIHINTVTQDDTNAGLFDPFRAPEPIGYTGKWEVPNGAFSYDGRIYVFAGFPDPKYSDRVRPGDPQPGQYLFSKANPKHPGPYDTEFMLSPKLGWCARDASRAVFESHMPLGYHFFLAHDLAPAPDRLSGWRCCSKCEAVYFDGDGSFKGVCQRGGPHKPDTSILDVFSLEVGVPEDVQNQTNWKLCSSCLALYYSGDSEAGLCPASGQHVPTPQLVFRVPHSSIKPGQFGQDDWRFCDKCNSLFWNGDGGNGVCARDRLAHEEAGFNFQVPYTTSPVHQPDQFWRYCLKCASLFHQGAGGICPKDHGPHEAEGWYFSPPTNKPTSVEWQGNWRQCSKCAGLYFDGYSDNKGCCPADGLGHNHNPSDPGYELPHNPGRDAHTRDQLRFCVRCHGLVRADQLTWFSFTSPTVVNNHDHPVLNAPSGQGVVMISYDWTNFRLSWMPLTPGQPPRFDSILNFHVAKRWWSDTVDNTPGYQLFAHPFPGRYTHVSASWLAGPRCWVVLFGRAAGDVNQDEPIVARFSPDLLTWSDEVPLFDPHREHAYGVWMHDPAGGDQLNNIPPPQAPSDKAWAYGAFLIDRYTTWQPEYRLLNLRYLMSVGSPYQVQLMETTVHLPDPIVG
jgi:hypothetical protein